MRQTTQQTTRILCGGLFLFLLGLTGCSAPLQSVRIHADLPGNFPQISELSSTPFFPQSEMQCGPAALATVLGNAGKTVTPAQLTQQVFLPERHGSLQIEMLAAARQHGVIPFVIKKEMVSLLQEIAAGNPVLVMQNLGLELAPEWHYAVVVGYNLQTDDVVLRSGPYLRHINSFTLFERTWRRGEYWGVVMLPPDKIPATADAFAYTKAVNTFEQLGRYALAEQAYRTASQHWPNDIYVWMGLGNAQYHQKKLLDATDSYRRVVLLKADFAPALNNLAQVLFERGNFKEALPYARHAVALGGPHTTTYSETLTNILESTGKMPRQ